MDFIIEVEQLKKALSEFEDLKSRGFCASKCVFTLASYGKFLDEKKARFADMSVAVKHNDPATNFKRYNPHITKTAVFKDGTVIDKGKAIKRHF